MTTSYHVVLYRFVDLAYNTLATLKHLSFGGSVEIPQISSIFAQAQKFRTRKFGCFIAILCHCRIV